MPRPPSFSSLAVSTEQDSLLSGEAKAVVATVVNTVKAKTVEGSTVPAISFMATVTEHNSAIPENKQAIPRRKNVERMIPDLMDGL